MAIKSKIKTSNTKEPKTITEVMDRYYNIERETKKKKTNRAITTEIRKKIDQQIDESPNTIWLQNVSGAMFIVQPDDQQFQGNNRLIELDKFELNEIKDIDKAIVQNRRFRDALYKGQLEIVDENDVDDIRKQLQDDLEKEIAIIEGKLEGDSGGAGCETSGLPTNVKTAIHIILDCEDLDLLEEWATMEKRDKVVRYIQDRIDELTQ